MSEPSTPARTGERTPDSEGERLYPTSRRAVLAGGATLSVGSVAGCLGSSEPTSSDGPEPPWTTEQLADALDGDETLTIYTGLDVEQPWEDLVDVINDEFGTEIQVDVFAANGSKVSSRFRQEHNANEHQADVLNTISSISDEIKIKAKEEDREAAMEIPKKYFDMNLNEDFWFKDVVPDWRLLPFMVSTFNVAPKLTLPVNKKTIEEQGASVPTTYNDLLKDEYEGMTMVIPGWVGPKWLGWIVQNNAEDKEMGNMEWADALRSHLTFEGASSHEAAAERVGRGDAEMMIYTYPSGLGKIAAEFPDLYPVFPKHNFEEAGAGNLYINKNAPNKWAARFFTSAVLEESVQWRHWNDVKDHIPGRHDIDYSDIEKSSYAERWFNADATEMGFFEGSEYSVVGQEAKDKDKFAVS